MIVFIYFFNSNEICENHTTYSNKLHMTRKTHNKYSRKSRYNLKTHKYSRKSRYNLKTHKIILS